MSLKLSMGTVDGAESPIATTIPIGETIADEDASETIRKEPKPRFLQSKTITKKAVKVLQKLILKNGDGVVDENKRDKQTVTTSIPQRGGNSDSPKNADFATTLKITGSQSTDYRKGNNSIITPASPSPSPSPSLASKLYRY